MISVPLWLTQEHQCSYFDNRLSRSAVVHPEFEMDTKLYSQLITQGFRRSGDQVYKPYCNACLACVPTRIPVKQFQPNRAQKRCLKRNSETAVIIKPAGFDHEHFDLYQRYQRARHKEKDEAVSCSRGDYIRFLASHWCNTWFVEFSVANRLMAVAVVDVLENALSAVYTFFDPEFNRYSPGVYAVLWQIEQAKRRRLDYVYLGFWIKECRKMSYKIQYQPLEGLIADKWQTISEHASI
ncbi:arginyltransferase [Methylomonas sp. MgM2]